MAVERSDSEQEIEKKIEETRQRFKKEYVQDSPDKYDPRDVDRLERDNDLVEGYLTWRQFALDDTLKMIDESLQWRKEFKLNDLTESSIPKWTFETGAVYLHGHDKEGNKLFWFNVRLHVKDSKTSQDKKRYVAFWLERYAQREPGKSLTVMFDMSDAGISNIDMDFVKYIISCFRIYYPKFLSKMLLYEMPWIMNAAWKIVKTWLGPEAIEKLKFVSKKEVQDYVDPAQLPPHMGGTDPFIYSYPPLPDNDFQSPSCENGQIAGEDGKTNFSSAHALELKKVNSAEDSLKLEEWNKINTSCRVRGARKPTNTFMGSLLHISPAEELCFRSEETEKRCLIVLSNVTNDQVAFKVRTTAPEKYRVKPSSSSCVPGASVDIVVSLNGGFQSSPGDQFLVLAAGREQNAGSSSPDLSQFWKDVSKPKVMEHRLRCRVLESTKPPLSLLNHRPVPPRSGGPQDLELTLLRITASSSRLEQRLHRCLWFQKVLAVLVSVLMAFSVSTLYLLSSGKMPSEPGPSPPSL